MAYDALVGVLKLPYMLNFVAIVKADFIFFRGP